MKSFQIDILNPKATKLLQDLADLNLIAIRETNDLKFQKVLNRLRKKAAADLPTLEEITKEVEIVRSTNYEKRKG
jgi:hypothetical protein